MYHVVPPDFTLVLSGAIKGKMPAALLRRAFPSFSSIYGWHECPVVGRCTPLQVEFDHLGQTSGSGRSLFGPRINHLCNRHNARVYWENWWHRDNFDMRPERGIFPSFGSEQREGPITTHIIVGIFLTVIWRRTKEERIAIKKLQLP